VATVIVNLPDVIKLSNRTTGLDEKTAPTVVMQLGDWDAGDHVEYGILIDVYGNEAPILTAADARKLSKWLVRAADELDGSKKPNKNKKRSRSEDDDSY